MKKKFFIFYVILLVLSSFVFAVGTAPNAAETISYWGFDTSIIGGGDYTPNNNNAVPQGASFTVSGKYLGAYSYDGTNDYSDIDSVINDLTTSSGSLCAWIYLDDYTVQRSVFAFGDENANEVLQVVVETSGLVTASARIATGLKWAFDTDAAISTGVWQHMCLVHDGTEAELYINSAKPAQAYFITTDKTFWWDSLGTIDRGRLGNRNYNNFGEISFFKGRIDEAVVFDTNLSVENMQYLYNGGVPGAAQQYPYIQPINIFELEAFNIYNQTKILEFNATIINSTNTTFIETTNGSIFYNVNELVNITISSNNYFNKTYQNYNTTQDLQGELFPYFYFEGLQNYNYVTYLNDNYTRILKTNISLSCRDSVDTSIKSIINNSVFKLTNLTCNNILTNYTIENQFTSEGWYNVSFNISNSDISLNQTNSNNQTFIWDLLNPVAQGSFSIINNFDKDGNVTLTCSDTITPLLTYNNTFNGNLIYFDDEANGTTVFNVTQLNNGLNTLVSECSDFFGSDQDLKAETLTQKTFVLWDEIDNVMFDVTNLTGARIYLTDTFFYDLKGNSTSEINFTSLNQTQVRIVLTYIDGTEITRFVDASVVLTDPVKICANKQGVTHYEQLLFAGTERLGIVKNSFSECFVAADYTRFVFSDTLTLKYFTVNAIYHLVTTDSGGNQAILASVDGSIPSTVNIDVVEFVKRGYDFSILSEGLSFEKQSNDTVIIYYNNQANDSILSTIQVTNLDDSQIIFTQDIIATPNAFSVIFDYGTINVGNNTLFKVSVEKTRSDLSTSSVINYFNPEGDAGFLTSEFVAVIAIAILVFGLTFVSASETFSWFGIIIDLAAIAFCTLAVQVWYIILIEAVCIMFLIYKVLFMIFKNPETVS